MKNLPGKTQARALAAMLTSLALASLSCTVLFPPTATPTATATLTPTSTSTFTPTETPTITVIPSDTKEPTQSYTEWPVVISDSFDDNENGWPEEPVDDEMIKATFTIANGKYNVHLEAKASIIEWMLPIMRIFKSQYASVNIFQTGGTKDADYGLVFRITGHNFYYFGISITKKSYILLLLNNNKWSTLRKWSHSQEILTDQPNQVAVLADGSAISLFINGQMVDQYDDETLVQGKAGVAMDLYNAGDQIDVEFDDFEIRAPRS